MIRSRADDPMDPMLSLHHCVPGALADLLSRQPHSPAKVAFAWRTAVGDAIARATTPTLTDTGTMRVHASDQHWRREVLRSKPLVLERLRSMLGRERVARLTVSAPVEQRPRRRRRGEPKPEVGGDDR